MLNKIVGKLEEGRKLNSNERRYLRLSIENDSIKNMNTPMWKVVLSGIAFFLFGTFFLYMQSLRYAS